MKFSTLTTFFPTLEEEYAIYFWSDGVKRAEAAAFQLEADGHKVTLVDISIEALRELGSFEGFVLHKPLIGDASTSFLALTRQEWKIIPTSSCDETEIGMHYCVVKLWRQPTPEATAEESEKGNGSRGGGQSNKSEDNASSGVFFYDIIGPPKFPL